MKQTSTLILTLAVALFTFGCGDASGTAESTPAAVEQAPPSTTADVAFEPAYPEDVSTESLSAQDAAQQRTHAHDGGEVHAHDQTSGGKDAHGH